MPYTIITERNVARHIPNEKMHVGVLDTVLEGRIFGYYGFSVDEVKDLVRRYRPTAKLLYVVSFRTRAA